MRKIYMRRLFFTLYMHLAAFFVHVHVRAFPVEDPCVNRDFLFFCHDQTKIESFPGV